MTQTDTEHTLEQFGCTVSWKVPDYKLFNQRNRSSLITSAPAFCLETMMMMSTRPSRGFSLLVASLLAVMALLGCTSIATAFQTTPSWTTRSSSRPTATAMQMANDEDFLRWARASRSAQADDTVVELMRPLGLVLNEDDKGNVYVETVAPKGNAARQGGKIKEGDIVTMCSATFGDQMWSTRGVGLTRVLAAIRVRAGPTVKLVLESPTGYKKKQAATQAQLAAKEKAYAAAQAKKDALLSELEQDEARLKKGKFFGLF